MMRLPKRQLVKREHPRESAKSARLVKPSKCANKKRCRKDKEPQLKQRNDSLLSSKRSTTLKTRRSYSVPKLDNLIPGIAGLTAQRMSASLYPAVTLIWAL